jgi:hypothetical protein
MGRKEARVAISIPAAENLHRRRHHCILMFAARMAFPQVSISTWMT